MRPVDTTGRPATAPTGSAASPTHPAVAPARPPAAPSRSAVEPARSEAELVGLTTRLANQLPNAPAPVPTPADAGPLTGRVVDRGGDVLRSSTAPAVGPTDRPWSLPLLVAPEVEAWLVGWPVGLVTPAHDHGRATVALTVVEGSLSEECLDPTIWTTVRRTTWPAGASTLFPAGHVHLLWAAVGRPAVAVLAWSGPAGSADGGAGRLALAARRAAAAGLGSGGGRDVAEPLGVGPGRGGGGCLAGHAAHGVLDLGHVRDRVAG
jgi:Cysteine dioxygenase type I